MKNKIYGSKIIVKMSLFLFCLFLSRIFVELENSKWREMKEKEMQADFDMNNQVENPILLRGLIKTRSRELTAKIKALKK